MRPGDWLLGQSLGDGRGGGRALLTLKTPQRPPPPPEAVMEADSRPDSRLRGAEARMKIHGDGVSGFFSGFSPSAWEEGGLEPGLCVPRALGSRLLGGNRASYRRDLSRPSCPVGRWGLEFPESPAQTTRTFDLDQTRACGRSPTQRPHPGLPPGHSRWQDTHPFSKDHMEPRDPLAPSRGPGHRETQLLISSVLRHSVCGSGVTLPECPGGSRARPLWIFLCSLSPVGLPSSAE